MEWRTKLKTVNVIAPAKINLALDIVGLDDRNYHLMNMIMQSITVYDTLAVALSEKRGIAINSNIRYIPNDERNIAHKVASAFFTAMNIADFGVKIDMKKLIPSQAGMAGGSADGAAVLLALNELYQTKLSMSELCDIGEKIGADIPFCLVGGTAHVTGFGEKIRKIADMPPCTIVIAKPARGINTKMAFEQIDKRGISGEFDEMDFIKALESKDVPQISAKLYNAFEQVCDVRDVFTIKKTLIEHGAQNAVMTGSGSAVFGIFSDILKARECLASIKDSYVFSALCHPCKHGVKIVKKNFN